MPCNARPPNERQTLERERAELAGRLAARRAELLDATAPEHTERRERLQWQIQRVLAAG